ncbi:hypothetical protein [uncultured Limosilactobacillus sp.]|uniref:hypothetical protein n=1 Tax=uncultured Limosilactobacillus sp. TaxID=2837629 RepID=UPI0025F27866|nr:hypothetical protein [uncultured Limosilactobacillus sp.]
MTLRRETKHVTAAKIIGMTGTRVTIITARGRLMIIPLTKKNRHDRLMMASLKDIWREGIWIPVNTKLKRFFRSDWLTQPATVK